MASIEVPIAEVTEVLCQHLASLHNDLAVMTVRARQAEARAQRLQQELDAARTSDTP